MATPTRARSKPRSSSGSRSTRDSSSNGARKPSAKRNTRPVKRDRGRSERSMTKSVAESLRRQPRHVWGYLLLIVAALSALAIYLDLAGPAGNALSRASARFVGELRFAVPLGLIAISISLISVHGRPLRTLLGATAAIASVAVLAHLIWESPADGAGGLLGRILGDPLAGVIGPWGGGLIAVFTLIGSLWLLFSEQLVGLRESRRELRSESGAATGEAGTDAADRSATLKQRWNEKRARRRALRDEAVLAASLAAAAGATGGEVRVFDFETEAESNLPTVRPAGRKRRRASADAPIEPITEPDGQLAMPLANSDQTPTDKRWNLPAASLLKRGSGEQQDPRLLKETGGVLEETLRQFDVDATLSGITPGPTVTRFEVELAPGVKVAKVKGLGDDIAYALAAERVRIQAPIPGKSAIGVEIPNRKRQLVTLGDILGGKEAAVASHPLECGLGKDISGRPVMLNLAEMPHLLIAGTTGGGKSSTINSLVTTLIMRNGPDRVRLILVDPKRVELGAYDGVPHLLTRVVTNPKRASEALAWTVREMERRYDVLAEAGARDIVSFNQSVGTRGAKNDDGDVIEAMGYIVVVVDELNDLMMVAARDVEDSIMRLAQMARAVGIHLVVATQRPSTNVITGVIKANIPSRIAFKVGSQVDSRVILDTGGAERLVGMGDMLMLAASASTPRRIQGCYVSEDEVHKIVAHWKRQAEPTYRDSEIFTSSESKVGAGAGVDGSDDLLDQALELVVRSQLGSTSMLQRKLRVGFSRAGRLMDLLERKGVVGPSEGSKARTVLMTVDELDQLLASNSE